MLELFFIEGSRQGETIRLNFEKAWFGRQPTCDFVLQGDGVGRTHFSIMRRGLDYVLIDNKSTTGTFVNRVRTTAVTLRAGYLISVGPVTMQVREATQTAPAAFRFVVMRKGVQETPQIIEQSAFQLGRKNMCQLQLNDPAVSPIHAALEHQPEGVWITDQSSVAGVYVNGQRVVTQQLRHGDVVIIRPFEIRIVLTEEKCLLGIIDHSREGQAALKKLPGSYREVVAAPPHREAGLAKPSTAISALADWRQAKAPIWVPTSDILPNRFRSILALVCSLAGLAWAGYAWAARSQTLYSPGPTTRFHSLANARFSLQLEGDGKSPECSACHVSFAGVSAAKCQNCHDEVYKGPDGTAADKHFLVHQQRGIACAVCHQEHKGAVFDLARTAGETCQSAGCHVRVHRKLALVARLTRPTPVPQVLAVAFEANWVVGSDSDVHPTHKDAGVKCAQCHVMPAKEGDEMPVVPRPEMRYKCLTCHGFGPQATLQIRCYSCHFEHPTEAPEKISPTRFPERQAPPARAVVAGSRRGGAVVLLSALLAVPLFFLAAVAGGFRLQYRFFRARTAIMVRAAPPLVTEEPAPAVPSAPASPEPNPTDNQAPGGNLRPQINLDLCVGCGSCVQVCPFNVLEVVNEKAIAVRLGDCTGFAACAAECPTEAIKLVTGGAMQTVELPVYDNASLETNVPGLYLAGEVTGKALIKVAINQGKRVVDAILRQRPQPGEHFDVIVIGAGPAGTSTALAARSEGLKVLVLEQGSLANTIRNYPRQKFVMAEPVMIPVYGPLWIEDSSKEALLERWQQIIEATGLAINTEERVLHVARHADHFLVQSTKAEYRGARVVLAIGKRGSPRKLGVPGEDTAKVAYNLLDADAYHGKAICVVGGGDSGIEAANGLARTDLQNRVWLVHNGEDFSRAKPRNRKKIQKSMEDGRLRVFFGAGVVEIGERALRVQSATGVEEIENDFVFVMVGGENPKKFLNECGIEFSQRALG